MKFRLFVILVLFLTSCSRPQTQSYRDQYSHLQMDRKAFPVMQETDYFLVLLVNARHLDYTSEKSFIATMQKHPDDGGKEGDVGHAWIYLKGNGEVLEGGHTGDFGNLQAKYFDGIMNYIEYGYGNPTAEQQASPIFEPNPVKYMWESQQDGICHKGCGGHRPTFAIKIDLTPETYQKIKRFIETYDFSDYALTGNQCSSYVAQVAAIAGLDLETQMTMPIHPTLHFQGTTYTLWRDDIYSTLTFSTPDVLERSMIRAVQEGHAEYALPWYMTTKIYR